MTDPTEATDLVAEMQMREAHRVAHLPLPERLAHMTPANRLALVDACSTEQEFSRLADLVVKDQISEIAFMLAAEAPVEIGADQLAVIAQAIQYYGFSVSVAPTQPAEYVGQILCVERIS